MEMSTKWAVGRHREVVDPNALGLGGRRGAGKHAPRDPRFEPMSSTAATGRAEREYLELLGEKREEELKQVQRAIKKENRRRGGRDASGADPDAKISVLKKSLAQHAVELSSQVSKATLARLGDEAPDLSSGGSRSS